MGKGTDAAVMLHRLFLATREGRVAWTRLPDHETKQTVSADIGENYRVQVVCTDKDEGPDLSVCLFHCDHVVIDVDSRNVNAGTLLRELGPQDKDLAPFPYTFFMDLWRAAAASADAATGHLRTATRLVEGLTEKGGAGGGGRSRTGE